MTDIQEIQPAELAALAANGPIDIVDVRTPAEFSAVHADGAVNFPLDKLDPAHVASQRKADSDQPLYVICKMGGRSRKACEAFVAAGIENVVNVASGTDGWVAAGLPSVKSDRQVMSLDRQVRIVAGGLVLIGAILSWAHSMGWIALPIGIGAGLVYSGISDTCGMAMMLAKMPWNRA